MTISKTKNSFDTKRTPSISFLIFIVSALILIVFSKEVGIAILLGVKISLTSILPAVFPFFILSDYFICGFKENKKSLLGLGFEKLFGISAAAFPAFIAGVLCGFPMGTKVATDLYTDGQLSKSEYERLIGFTNNPSPAFVISGIGTGMRGETRDGIILYSSVILSSVIVGIIFAQKRDNCNFIEYNIEQKFNIVNSIKSAGLSSLYVSSYIIFFSMVLGILSVFIKSDTAIAIIASILEVGNAADKITKVAEFSPGISILLTGFALGFSGLSVHMQAFSFIPGDIKKRKYILMKIIQGIFSALLALFIYMI